jgi:hypothetical protein
MDQNMPAVLVAYYMQRELKKYLDDHKGDLMRELNPGDSVSARYDLDGQELPLGKATRTEPRPAWKVTDSDALMEWAETNMPDLVVTQKALDKSGVDELLRTVKHQNAAITSEGEVIPGIEWDNTGGSYVRFTPAKDIAEKLALLNREGRLGGLTGEVLGIEPTAES